MVIVLVFVRGSKWVSGSRKGKMGGRIGDGEREERDSKSERSNQSLLLGLDDGDGGEGRLKCRCHDGRDGSYGGEEPEWGNWGWGTRERGAMELRNTVYRIG